MTFLALDLLVIAAVAFLVWLEPDADEICAEHMSGLDDEAREIVACLNLSLTPPPLAADATPEAANALLCENAQGAEGEGEGRE